MEKFSVFAKLQEKVLEKPKKIFKADLQKYIEGLEPTSFLTAPRRSHF